MRSVSLSTTGSHKKRDNRCAIAAPKLEASLTSALEREHWEVHTQLSEPHTPPASSNESDRLAQLKDVADSKSALILKTSHIGGHKFAGNVIVSVLLDGVYTLNLTCPRFTRRKALLCGTVASHLTMSTRSSVILSSVERSYRSY